MKNARQKEILNLIRNHTVENQEMLQELLKERGFPVTQATISRDIRELNLIKKANENGIYHYIQQEFSVPQGDLFSNHIVSVDFAGNITVVRCQVGTAQAVCTMLDSVQRPDIVGTIAGDDTIFVLLRTGEQAKQFCAELNEKIQNR